MLQELINGEGWQDDVGQAEAAIRCAHKSKDRDAVVAGICALHLAKLRQTGVAE